MELKRQYGHDTFVPEPKEVAPGFFQFQMKTIPSADIYVLQQRPEKEWLKLIPFLKDRGKIVVCETDDYYLGIPTWHPAYEPTRPLVKDLHKIYSLSDAMTVSTPFLEEAYRRYNDKVFLLPNYWQEEMWAEIPEKNWERLRIGWMGISRMRPSDMQVLKGVIGPFLKRHPEVDFVAAGDPLVHDIWDIPEGQRISLPRVHLPQTPKLMQFDIGLVPLSDHDFNQGKSYLKGMEYNIAGIPYVASPTRPYKEYTDEGKNGFLAKRAHDWARHLERLVSDDNLRREMGVMAARKASAFKIADHAYKWNEVYSSLLGDEWDQVARDAIDRFALQKPDELAPFLRFLAARGAPEVVVEIGTAQGGMLFALAQVAADDALLVSIDLPGGDRDETSEDDKYGARDTDKMASYVKKGQTVEFLQADSHSPATRGCLERILESRGAEIDVLFIDGDHAYDGVKRDFEIYSPMVGPQGVVAFHDIVTHANHRGSEVDRLWSEIKNDHSFREFKAPGDWGWGPWGGIGVLEMQREAVTA